jgi:hypothetical protein
MSNGGKLAARDGTVLMLVSAILAVGIAAFLVGRYAVGSKNAGVSAPNPHTVTCGGFANLSREQQRAIAAELLTSAPFVMEMCRIDGRHRVRVAAVINEP